MRFRASKSVLGVAAVAALLAFSTAASATPISKCNAAKKKCIGKYAAAVLKCHEKAEKKNLPVDPVCLSKATAKITGAGKGCFDKKDAKNDGCTNTGDAATQLAKADAFILDVVEELDPSYPAPIYNKCSATKKKCVGKKAAGLMNCEAKANKTGTVDPACTSKQVDKFGGAKGCFPKPETKENPAKPETICLTVGDVAAIEAKVDAWVADVVAEIDNPAVPTPTPTPTVTVTGTPTLTATPTPTATLTPVPGGFCGDNVWNIGEDCDGVGTQCPTYGTGFLCNASCQCPCPSKVTFLPNELDPVTKLDVGWTGIAHSSGTVSDGLLTVTVSGCASSTRPCGQCTLSGPVENEGSDVFKSRRCTNNTSVKCSSDTPCFQQCVGGTKDGLACTATSQCTGGTCPNAGTCQFFFGSTLPLSSGGVATCTANEVASSLTGTANIETGESASTLNLTAHVFTGITTDQPCPQCNGDGTRNDGVAGGTCSGGDRNGLACDVNGVSPNPYFGSTSLDCPPLAGANIANLAIGLGNSTGQEKKTLTAANPNCRALGYTGNKCFCDTCNNLAATPCSSNADCIAVGATICSGKRCLSGSNAGAPCSVASECPGGSCTVPGTPTAPNACLPPDGAPDGCQPVGNNQGLCADGPTDNNCAPPEQQKGCLSGADCPLTGNCVPALRLCFLDMGLVAPSGDCAGGSNEGALCAVDSECPGGVCQQRGELIAQGAADTPVYDHSTPTVASVFCIGPTGASAVNNVAGLPGPARLILRGSAQGLP